MRVRARAALSTLLALTLAVLCGAVAGADGIDGDAMANVSRVHRAAPAHHPHRVLYVDRTDEEEATAAWKRSHWREMKSILQHEGATKEEVECCPSVLEMVAKKGGRTPTGLYVELYEDGENQQRFYELSCAPGVVDKPCRFVDARLYNQSRCVQKYSYTYALVRYSAATEMPQFRHQARTQGHFNVPGSGGWSMDYVIVRAGCECQITPPKRKNAHRRRPERQRHKRKNRKLEEDDDT